MRYHQFHGCGFGAGPEPTALPPSPVPPPMPTAPLVIPPAMAPIPPPIATPVSPVPTTTPPTPASVVSQAPTPQLAMSPTHPIPGVHSGMHHGVICVPAVFIDIEPKL